MDKIVYLDNAATTRTLDEIRDAIEYAENNLYFNTAAMYAGSLRSRKAVGDASAIIKKRLTKSGSGNLIFTSGATESNNMVILGIATNLRHHVLVVSGEHSSVHSPAVYLSNQGFDVEYVPLNSDGTVDLVALERLVRPNTALFVFGMVNSDTGVMQDVEAIVRVVRGRNSKAHIHCDAVQAFCKFDFDVDKLGLDSVAISAHKIYGPKGIGALWLRKGVNLKSIMYGGAQQDFRPGTEDTPRVMGFTMAVQTFDTCANAGKVAQLRNRLTSGLTKDCVINGKQNNPYIINISLPNNILGATVVNALSECGIYVGLGSACATNSAKNRTLLAMGLTEKQTKQVIRVSLGIKNTECDVDVFLMELKRCLNCL